MYYAHTIAGPSVLAPSPPAYLVDLTTAYIVHICPAVASPWKIGIHDLNHVILKRILMRVQCTMLLLHYDYYHTTITPFITAHNVLLSLQLHFTAIKHQTAAESENKPTELSVHTHATIIYTHHCQLVLSLSPKTETYLAKQWTADGWVALRVCSLFPMAV